MNLFSNTIDPAVEFGAERTPDFFCVGTEKAGTTWLWNCLISHEHVGVPRSKELRYFVKNRRFEYGHFRALKTLMNNPRSAPTRPEFLERVATELRLIRGGQSAYLRIFGQLKEPIVGELTPQYCIQTDDLLYQMRQTSPNARIIYMLRDPVARAISGGRMTLKQRSLDPNDISLFREATNSTQDRLSNAAWHIDRYVKIFGAEKLHVIHYDDISIRPQGVLDDLSDFLSVERSQIPEKVLAERVNKGGTFVPAQSSLQDLYRHYAPYYAALEPRFPEQVRAWRSLYE